MKKNSPITSKSHVRKVGIFSLIIVALVVIASSVFVLLNPNGLETANETQDGTVTIGSTGVTPSELRIKQGESVTWNNASKTPRQIVLTSVNPPKELEGFGSGEALMQDESYSFTFDAKGSFTYEDPNTPEAIKGTIVVE